MENRSKNGRFSLYLSDESWISNNARSGEVKLSSKIRVDKEVKDWKYLILGISEDIGPQINNGFEGAKNGFSSFVSAIQNVQSNDFIDGSEIGFLGEIIQNQNFESLENSTGWVEELDDFVYETLQKYSFVSQTIIVIGGGHNNAYPLLRNSKTQFNKPVHAINIDPHADCRTTDFRHSGNPFSYAIKDGYLDKYSIVGLHESYNNQFILDFIAENEIDAIYFEQFLDNEIAFWKTIDNIASSVNHDNTYTLDLDLDSIAFCPSSARTPSGFTIEDCRKIIRKLSSEIKFSYLHLPEGSPETESEKRNYGKMLSYFVIDFIKCQNKLEK
jgi:formiminoglutamase